MATQQVADAITQAILNAEPFDPEAGEPADDSVAAVATTFASAIHSAVIGAYENDLIDDYEQALEMLEELGIIVRGD